MILGLVGFLVLAVLAWIRLAPDDPAAWNLASKAHVMALEDPGHQTLPDAMAALGTANPAQVGCVVPGAPADVLARLDAIALASPRTQRLAGSPQEGRITWVQRSFLMGYPDYITAEADAVPGGTRLDVISRQRYGSGDMGVNAARLKDWLGQL